MEEKLLATIRPPREITERIETVLTNVVPLVKGQ